MMIRRLHNKSCCAVYLTRRSFTTLAERTAQLCQCLKVDHASEEVLKSFMEGQKWAMSGRIDYGYFAEKATENSDEVEDILSSYGGSKSSLLPFLRPLGFLFGAASAHAPISTRLAIYGALQDSLSDEYNDQIRNLLDDGLLRRNEKLKHAFVALRDRYRVPEGSAAPPDLRNLQKIEEISLSQGIGALVKGSCKLTINIISKMNFYLALRDTNREPDMAYLYRYRPQHETELAIVANEDGHEPVTEIKKVRLRSIKSRESIWIDFYNATKVEVRTIWLDYHGNEILYRTIGPGQTRRQHTFLTHPWIVRNVETESRMLINYLEVFFGYQRIQKVTITHPPSLTWTVERHKYFPSDFKQRVHTLLLCHHRLRNGEPRTVSGNEQFSRIWRQLKLRLFSLQQSQSEPTPAEDSPRRTLGDIDSFILKKIIEFLSMEFPVSQTLLKGIDAAPDLAPVSLPKEVPFEQFSPSVRGA